MNTSSKNNRSDLLKFALLALVVTWAGFAYVELGNWMAGKTLFARLIDGKPYVSDFANHYNAAVLARRCLSEPVDIYDPAVQNASLLPLIAPVVPELPFYLQYPPYFFALVLPLSFVSMNAAWTAWVAAGLGATAWTAWMLTREMPRPERVKAVLLVLASFPAWLSSQLGQTSFLLVPALAASLMLVPGRAFPAGFASCLAMIKLQYYPILGLVGLATGGWRYFAGALSGGVILAALSLMVVGVDNCLRFPQALFEGETGSHTSGVAAASMQNVRGELLLFLGESSLAWQLSLAFFVIAAAFTFWLWLKVYPQVKATQDHDIRPLFWSATVLIMLISSLHCHTQDYLAASLPCIWLFCASPKLKSSALIRRLILSFSGVSWIFFFAMPVFQLLRIQPFLLFALVLLWLTLKEIMSLRGANFPAAAKSS